MSTTHDNGTPKTVTTGTAGIIPNSEDTEIARLKKQLELEAKMRKDTQASYTKSQQELARLKAEKEALATLPTISDEEVERLDNLKVVDPDAWYFEKLKIERSKEQHIQAKLREVETNFTLEAELANRGAVLNSFNQTRQTQGLPPLTEDLIAVDNIPPRITKRLESGEIDYATWLEEVADYAVAPKRVPNQPTLEQPTLGNTNGGQSPQQPNQPTYTGVVY